MSTDSVLAEPETAGDGKFNVHLVNFEGPFDLLLQLISRHKMDITEVALSKVTNEFIAHIKSFGLNWDLEQTSQFVLVAATLLDLKASKLIPSGEVDDPEDLALLEARDLLFARLLQYRAFKQVAAYLGTTLEAQGRRYPRTAGLEEQFTHLLPEVTIHVTHDRFAQIAAKAMTPKEADVLSLAHLHTSTVTVREQAIVVVDRLRRNKALTFRALTGDSPDKVTTVCRFLSLLELFREGAVAFEQVTPLGELTIRWTGAEDGELTISDEFDAPPGTDPEEAAGAGDENETTEPSGDTDTASEDIDAEDENTDAGDEAIDAGDEAIDAADENIDAADENTDAADEESDAAENFGTDGLEVPDSVNSIDDDRRNEEEL